MSDGKLEKMEKDYSPQVDALLPETDALLKVQQHSPSSFYFFFCAINESDNRCLPL